MMFNQDEFFTKLGFDKYNMEYAAHGKYSCYKGPDGGFYKIDHFSKFYVIEYAENEYDAAHGIFEDTDLFDDALPEEELERQFMKWFEKYVGIG